MELNFNKVNEQSLKKQKTRKKFIELLKKEKSLRIDELIQKSHEQVFKEINCLECANCCTQVGPLFTTKDIARISKEKKMSPGHFTAKYLKIDEENDFVLKALPCPFLSENNYCSIYTFRPKACKEYPHTNVRGQKKLLKLHLKNCAYCPGVNEIFNKLSKRDLKK